MRKVNLILHLYNEEIQAAQHKIIKAANKRNTSQLKFILLTEWSKCHNTKSQSKMAISSVLS